MVTIKLKKVGMGRAQGLLKNKHRAFRLKNYACLRVSAVVTHIQKLPETKDQTDYVFEETVLPKIEK